MIQVKVNGAAHIFDGCSSSFSPAWMYG